MVWCTGRSLTVLWISFLILGSAPVAPAQADGELKSSAPTTTSTPSAPSRDPSGQWVLALGKRTLFVLSIRYLPAERQQVAGSLSRPLHLQMNGSMQFSHIEGPTKVMPIVTSEWRGRLLLITVQDPKNPTDKDSFLLDVKNADHADLQIQGAPLPPFKLQRATSAVSVSTDWDVTRTYAIDDDVASNPEMRRIFEEDQKARQAGMKIDWAVVNKADSERRRAVSKLLNAGALHSGEDFNWAAFVFQHGSTPDDYLLAHTLAMIAIEKGYREALWIATATLDRYLQSIKQAQIYGTQYRTPTSAPTTQEPYDRTLISDALRLQLGVPAQSAQEAQRRQYDAERSAPAPNK